MRDVTFGKKTLPNGDVLFNVYHNKADEDGNVVRRAAGTISPVTADNGEVDSYFATLNVLFDSKAELEQAAKRELGDDADLVFQDLIPEDDEGVQILVARGVTVGRANPGDDLWQLDLATKKGLATLKEAKAYAQAKIREYHPMPDKPKRTRKVKTTNKPKAKAKPRNATRDAKIRKLREDGVAVKKIAKKFKLSPVRIYRILAAK